MAVATEGEGAQELAARQEKLRPWIIGVIAVVMVMAIGKQLRDGKTSRSDSQAAKLAEEREWALRRAAHPKLGDS